MDTTHHGNPTQTGTEKVGIVGGGKPDQLKRLHVEVTPYSVDGVISGEEIHYRGILNNFLARLASSVVSVDQAQTGSRPLSVCLSRKSGGEITHAVITTNPPPAQPVCGQGLVPDHLASRIIENLCRQVGLSR